MNRKDFRPNDNRTSGMSDKDRALIQSSKQRTTTRKGVVNDFLDGKKAKTGNESLSTDGNKLKSYNTVIATKQKDGTIVLNNTKYSSTTSRQQSELVREMDNRHIKYDVTGGKERGYEGEDFSEDKKYENIGNPYQDVSFKELSLDEKRKILSEQSYGKNYESLSSLQQDDVNNFLYKEHGMSVKESETEHKKFIKSNQYDMKIKEEHKASKEYKQLAKKNPEDKKKLTEISQEEKTHAKELKQLEKKPKEKTFFEKQSPEYRARVEREEKYYETADKRYNKNVAGRKVIASSQADDLVEETPTKRYWVSRVTGEKSSETLRNGRWELDD